MMDIEDIERLILGIEMDLANDDDLSLIDFHEIFVTLEGQLDFIRLTIKKMGDNEGIEQGEL